jgi:tetratricopeptide (TPR) repeat protein
VSQPDAPAPKQAPGRNLLVGHDTVRRANELYDRMQVDKAEQELERAETGYRRADAEGERLGALNLGRIFRAARRCGERLPSRTRARRAGGDPASKPVAEPLLPHRRGGGALSPRGGRWRACSRGQPRTLVEEHWAVGGGRGRVPTCGGGCGSRGALSLGQLMAENGRLVEAERLLRDAVENGDFDARVELAKVLGRQGNVEEAERLLREHPWEDDTSLELARLLAAQDRFDEAIDAYRQAAGRDPTALGELYALLNERGRADLARKELIDFADHDVPEALLLLGDVMRDEGNLDGAAESYSRAAVYDPRGDERLALLQEVERVDGFRFRARAVSDLPSEHDLLGFAPLVSGLHSLLNARSTSLPLTIAVTAPCGAGKSSVMLQLLNRLKRRAAQAQQPRLRVRDAFPPVFGREWPHASAEAQREVWWTVYFDAWKYERTERLWAALAMAMYEQPRAQMSGRERLVFRVGLECRRLGWPRFLLKAILPILAAAVAIAVAVAASPPAVAVLPAALATVIVAVATVAHILGAASDPFKRALQRYVSHPDYAQQLGFTHEADQDIAALTRTLAPTPRHAIAVFVDDLDRCSSAHLVEVVEAMNQIFSVSGRPIVFVLGMDREVVSASIDTAYAETVARLRESDDRWQSFGSDFLSKLVQLSVAVPPPAPAAIRQLLAHVTGTRPPPEAAGTPGNHPQARGEAADPRDDEQVSALKDAIAAKEPQSLAEVGDIADELATERRGDVTTVLVTNPDEQPVLPPSFGMAPGAPLQEAERQLRAELIASDSPDVVAAEYEVLRYLSANPRQIKRFDNAFRPQLYVASADPAADLKYEVDQLIALGKWVAIRLRWPDLAKDLDKEPFLIDALEAHANGTEAAETVAPEEIARLRDAYPRWFADRHLRTVAPGQQQQAALAPALQRVPQGCVTGREGLSTLRSWPWLGDARTGA